MSGNTAQEPNRTPDRKKHPRWGNVTHWRAGFTQRHKARKGRKGKKGSCFAPFACFAPLREPALSQNSLPVAAPWPKGFGLFGRIPAQALSVAVNGFGLCCQQTLNSERQREG
jgi:hypothetical protein